MEPTQSRPDDVPTAAWETSQPSALETRGSWRRWALPAALAAGGIVLGAAVGAGIMAGVSDPTQSDEYQTLSDEHRALEERYQGAREDIGTARREGAAAKEEAAEILEETRGLQEQLIAEAERVAAREAAVTAVEQQIAATSIKQGVWTVGVDIEPGTYRTADPVVGQCYWGIYASGSNGSDIIDNGIVNGGFPTVTLSAGQDFENNRCGTFVKQ